MNAMKATVKDGRIEIVAPAELQEGTEVLVEMTPLVAEKIGISESEWRDDPAALADWDAWIRTLEPLEFTPEEEAEIARFDEETRRFNLEAVKKQFGDGAAE